MPDSTPTSLEELNTALALVAAAQGANPWDPPCFFPRQVGAAATLQLIVLDIDNKTIDLYFDDELNDAAVAPEGFTVTLPATEGNVTTVTDLAADNAVDNSVHLSWTDTEGETPGRPTISYNASVDPVLTDANDRPILIFSAPLPPT